MKPKPLSTGSNGPNRGLFGGLVLLLAVVGICLFCTTLQWTMAWAHQEKVTADATNTPAYHRHG
jgi:ABC-type transporter Mla subunit MlaD